jgi:hypothetical protein
MTTLLLIAVAWLVAGAVVAGAFGAFVRAGRGGTR